jgi:hypothetical protein
MLYPRLNAGGNANTLREDRANARFIGGHPRRTVAPRLPRGLGEDPQP